MFDRLIKGMFVDHELPKPLRPNVKAHRLLTAGGKEQHSVPEYLSAHWLVNTPVMLTSGALFKIVGGPEEFCPLDC
jgi:hypothetical protein